MTKPVFDVDNPLPGYKDAPVITAEQMSRFLYCHVGRAVALEIAKAINTAFEPYGGRDKALHTTYTAPEPPKPTFLPIDRPVRIEDVEPGDILRFCWHDSPNPPEGGWAKLMLGEEYIVATKGASGKVGFTFSNFHAHGLYSYKYFSFVRRPGFAKVRDGYVKNGDTVWWLGRGGPEKGVVGDPAWEASNRHNIRSEAWCYQKAEPKVIIEHGREPKARYAYLESDYAIVRDNEGGAL